jgi:chitinase
MSYDLHGVWDSSNPIGSIVQGHTNLTEIKMAAELFWRVNIPPSKLSLGFGFYGRAFTLADPSCTSPGCAFSSGARPGVCTGTSGCELVFCCVILTNTDTLFR